MSMIKYENKQVAKQVTHDDVVAFLKSIGIDVIKDKIPMSFKPRNDDPTKIEILYLGSPDVPFTMNAAQKTQLEAQYPELAGKSV